MKNIINQMEMKFKALSVNESFARASVAGFCLQLNPSIDELTDIKTSVSEAVTNSIVHAYPNKLGDIKISIILFENEVEIEVSDFGIGIENLERAKQPFFTTKPEQDRSGMGFTVMESFMDEVIASNKKDGGLKVILRKKINEENVERIKKIN